MFMNHYFIVLCCLAIGLVVTTAVSPTKSPECTGMNKAKTSLEKGITTFTKEPIKCLVNGACTGISCNGTHKSQPFYMNMALEHCKKPKPMIHLDLIYPKRNLNIHRELSQDSTVTLYKLGIIEFQLKLHLNREQNKITASLDLETCPKFAKCSSFLELIPPTTFCVNMDTCPAGQFNTTGYPQCPLPSSTPATPGTNRPTGSPSASPFTPTGSYGHHSKRSFNTTHIPEPLDAKGHKKSDGHHHISVGMAVGIGFATLVAVLIVIGAIVYWKKFHHRTRLRAAYYNDISMNDPLYEDFGPEVA